MLITLFNIIRSFVQLNISIRTMDRTLTGTSAPVQSEPWSNSNDGVHHIPQSSSIARASTLGPVLNHI